MIRILASKLNPRTPAVDKESDDENAPKGGLGGGRRGDKPSVRERLDALSDFRIRSRAIKFASGDGRGSGGKGDVVKATWVKRWYSSEGEVVAVKKIRDLTTEKARNEFAHEVGLMAKMSHENIVKFVGFVEDLENGIAWIAMSWEPNGNVSEFVAKGSWEIVELVSLIKDTFGGIEYLHTRQPPICHGDLKSLNILVSSSYRAVITDFGSAREINTREGETMSDEGGQLPTTEQPCPPIHVAAAGSKLTLTGPAWSLRWASPEVVNGKRPSLSSDIWAAGWVCWEVMTNTLPFQELNSLSRITLATIRGEVPSPRDDGQLAQIVALCTLMTECWTFDPKGRPSVNQCCDGLKWMPTITPSGGNRSGSTEQSIKSLTSNGWMHYQQSDSKKAAVLLEQALSLTESEGNQGATAKVLRMLGPVYRAQSKFIEAEEALFRAMEIYTRNGDDHGRADALTELGDLYQLQYGYTQAEGLYTQAQEVYNRVGDEIGLANTLRGLGTVYRSQSKFAQAEKSLVQAQDIYTRIGNDVGQGQALTLLGTVYGLQNKLTEAEQSFIRAEELYARVGGTRGQATTLSMLGNTYRRQSNYSQAEESYARAREIYASVGDTLGQANALSGMGDLRRSQGRDVEATSYYCEAGDLYVKMGMTTQAEFISNKLAALSPDPQSSITSPQRSVSPNPLSTNISP